MADTTSDIVILGGGSGGYATALRGAQLGLSVTLIEEDKLGGTCLHSGCIPTKAMLHAAEVADAARGASRFGVRASFEGIDLLAVHEYRTDVIDRLHKGLSGLVKGRGITTVHGHGTLTSSNSVLVGTDTHAATKAVVLASGSYARALPGIDVGGRVLTSTEALELNTVPSSVIVLGGGVIGVEFASIWRSFGSEVTIIEALPTLVPSEDSAIGKALERAFNKRGIQFRTSTRVASVSQDTNGVRVALDDSTELTADYLLVAVGRGPRTEGLGYEEAGVEIDRGFVRVDANLQTSVPGVYAVGDIVPGLQLAHRGFLHGLFVAETIAGLSPASLEEANIPRVTYCEPEIASVGLTEDDARARHGDNIETVTYNLAGNGKSQILDTTGFVKLIRLRNGPVLGAHLIGARAGELIAEAQLAVAWEAHPEDAAGLIHAHPTQNEAMGEAFLALAGKPLHAHN